jgi:serine protease Do
VNESADLPRLVARTPVGKSVEVTALRGARERRFTVEIGELKDEVLAVPTATGEGLGMSVQTLTAEIAENLGLDRGLSGVVVTAVDPDGPAAESGIRRGDVLLEVNRRPIRNARQYEKALRGAGKEKSILFLVRRGDSTIFLALKPAD